MIGKDMIETIECFLLKNRIIPTSDNVHPQMINIFPIVLFFFMALIIRSENFKCRISYFFLLLPVHSVCRPQEYSDS